MSVLSPADAERVRQRLDALPGEVRLLFFTQTFGCDSCVEAQRILRSVTELSSKVAFVEHNLVLDKAIAEAHGVDRAPAVAIVAANPDGSEWDPGVCFAGATAGYEFAALLDAIELVARRDSGLSADSRALVAQITAPMRIQVFSTPTCPHCPRAVNLSHRMAIENPLISAVAVDATEFADLVRRHRVTGVPKTVVDDAGEILGALPEPDFVAQVVSIRTSARSLS